ncbi:hypothetical protein CR513_62666, partial [Mucuna pruriens]
MEGVQEDEDEEDKMQDIVRLKSGKRPISSSIDVSSIVAKKKNINTWDKVYQLLNNFVEEIGEENVIQVVTDNEKRYECRDLIDPIVLNDINDKNEWIVGELDGDGEDVKDELVFDDDVLTWRDVASTTRVAEPLKYTRRQTKMQMEVFASTSRKEKGKGVVEEDEDEPSQDEGEEEYNSSFNGSDGDNDMELQEDEEDY